VSTYKSLTFFFFDCLNSWYITLLCSVTGLHAKMHVYGAKYFASLISSGNQ
jgi:hypothetical protein